MGALRPGLARALLQATVEALTRVLLHGGSCRCPGTSKSGCHACSVWGLTCLLQQRSALLLQGRILRVEARVSKFWLARATGLIRQTRRCPRWFILDDVDMLEDDLSQLQALFEADGEGLSRGDIQVAHTPA